MPETMQETEVALPETGSVAEKIVAKQNQYPDWSARQVAESVGSSDAYVWATRKTFAHLLSKSYARVRSRQVTKRGAMKRKIQAYTKEHPNATAREVVKATGGSESYVKRTMSGKVYPKKIKEKGKAKSEKFPRKHSGRKNPLDNVLEIDAHRSAARMEGKFMAIETILSEGLADIGKTIGDIDKMPENRQRLKELLRGALLIAESMEPPAEQNTQREGHASVNAKVNLIKVK